MGELAVKVITPVRAKPVDFSGNIPWCKLEDVVGRTIGVSLTGKGVSKETVKKMHLNIMPKGTLLCSCSATLGVYAIAEMDIVTNQRFMGFLLSDEACSEYVLHYLRKITPTLSNKATGSTNAYVSRKKFESTLIPLPGWSKQIEIAHMLDEFEDRMYELTNTIGREEQGLITQLASFRNHLLSFPEKGA